MGHFLIHCEPIQLGCSPATGNLYFTLPEQPHSYLTLTTYVMTTACNIVCTQEVLGEQWHIIKCIPHLFEIQRMEVARLVTLHETFANVQIAQDTISSMIAKAGGGGEWLDVYHDHWITPTKAISGLSAKNPFKMFQQPANTGGAASIFVHLHMSLQSVQTGMWLGLVSF